jgi:hypothetical protein
MINLSDRVPAHDTQRARTELSAAWEHLLTAAQEAARQVGDTPRARRPLARLARRGEQPTWPWRWAGAGLATGAIIGAVTIVVLTRRPHPADPAAPPPQPDATSPALVDKARTAATAVAEKANAAAKAARDAADKARQKATGREPAAEPTPPPTPPATDNDS